MLTYVANEPSIFVGIPCDLAVVRSTRAIRATASRPNTLTATDFQTPVAVSRARPDNNRGGACARRPTGTLRHRRSPRRTSYALFYCTRCTRERLFISRGSSTNARRTCASVRDIRKLAAKRLAFFERRASGRVVHTRSTVTGVGRRRWSSRRRPENRRGHERTCSYVRVASRVL